MGRVRKGAEELIQPPLRSLDMRYQGVETTINVPYTQADTSGVGPAERYGELHQQLYGYTHDDRPIEITAARVEVVGQMPEPPVETMAVKHRRPNPAETTKTWFDGKQQTTAVFFREDLHAGDEITGPAIICEPTSTIVIDPDWSAALTERGGEGMVVKPRDFVARSKHGLVQPAVKCRGREYLRIIYGPDYTADEHLTRLRSRGLGAKRSLALREFALGIEALERFVRREPLRRVHECVFAVRALESVPVDPRL